MTPSVNFRNPIQRGKDSVGSDKDNWPVHRNGHIHGRSMDTRIPTDVTRNHHDSFYPGSRRPRDSVEMLSGFGNYLTEKYCMTLCYCYGIMYRGHPMFSLKYVCFGQILTQCAIDGLC